MTGEHCSANCLTKDHETWGECQRAKGIRIGWAHEAAGLDLTRERKWDAEIEDYRAARAEGINPAGTSRAHVKAAREVSDTVGVKYDSNDPFYERLKV